MKILAYFLRFLHLLEKARDFESEGFHYPYEERNSIFFLGIEIFYVTKISCSCGRIFYEKKIII